VSVLLVSTFLIGYLLGSIPFALIVSLPRGVDPRKAGSGNPGATNVARLLGKKWGVITFLGDSGKGILAIAITYLIAKKIHATNLNELLALAGTGAVLGHMFSLFLKFKGGKGVATTVGTFLILTPKAMLCSLVLFLLGVLISGFVSVGSLLCAASLPLFVHLFGYPKSFLLASVLLGILIWIKHKDNIKRLLRGEEKTWKKRD